MNTRDYVEANKITIENEYASVNPNMDNDGKWQANHYKVTLRRSGKQLTTYFSMGIALTDEPSAEGVLDCLASDAAGYQSAGNFESWASDYGYDTDSRRAEKMYIAIGRQVTQLKRFLGDDYDKVLFEIERL